jgi:hypothetical protein
MKGRFLMTLTIGRSTRRYFVAGFVIASLVCATGLMAAIQSPNELIVHEWGTFTSVAGADGSSVQWQPLSAPQDLPCFVNRLGRSDVKVVALDSYSAGQPGLTATIRMETPVLYFYSPREQNVDVGVQFRNGLMTEWFPYASVTPNAVPFTISNTTTATIRWNSVRVAAGNPQNFLAEKSPSHYYAARQTDAAPLQVGTQAEKFLFYRGLGGFQAPINVTTQDGGGVVWSPVPGMPAPEHLILFENRGGRIAYRRVDGPIRKTAIAAPEPASLDALHADLKAMLIEQGLFEREAAAMVETWRDSWFEEGTRVFYLMPQASVDAILPLTVVPAPAKTVRAFVGRVEVITPAILSEVATAFSKDDLGTLNKRGRFLDSIAARLLEKNMTGLDPARVQSALRRIAASHVPEMYCR